MYLTAMHTSQKCGRFDLKENKLQKLTCLRCATTTPWYKTNNVVETAHYEKQQQQLFY